MIKDTNELTTEQKAERIALLQQLIQHPGWTIIQEELGDDIAISESKLFGEVPLSEGETVDGLRRERIDRLEMKHLPQNLIAEYSDTHNPLDTEVYD